MIQNPQSRIVSRLSLDAINVKIHDKYMVVQKIGGGAFGQVYKAIDLKSQQKRYVAIKHLFISKILQSQYSQKQKRIKLQFIQRQDKIMQKFNHPNILPCYQLIITKYCNKGTLAEQIEKNKSLQLLHCINILQQISIALAVLHQKQIVHRDLKPQNIFIHNDKYIIGDFGLSKIMNQPNNGENNKFNTVCGTNNTQAPQIVTGRYKFNVDIYSLGVILYVMLCSQGKLQQRYQKAKQMDLNNIQFKIKNRNNVPNQVKQFLKKSLQKNPQKRMTWKQLKNHSIFKFNQNANIKSVSEIYCINIDKIQISNIQIDKINPNLIFDQNTSETTQNSHEKQTNLQIQSKYQQLELQEQTGFVQLSETQLQNLKLHHQNKKDSQTAIYKQVLQNIIYKKRAQYILYNIVQQIEKKKILNLNNKQNLQIMYMLSTRCFLYLSRIYQNLENQKRICVRKSVNLQQQGQISNLYKKAKKNYQKYSKLLTEKQNSIKQIIKNRFKIIFKNQQYNNIRKVKDVILNGIQKIDFNQHDHVEWTQYMLNSIQKCNIQTKDQEIVKDMLNNFKYFKKINQISYNELKNGKNFDKIVQQIIQGQK